VRWWYVVKEAFGIEESAILFVGIAYFERKQCYKHL
jgi:hypothetical protein